MTGDTVTSVDATLPAPGPKLAAWDASRPGETAFAMFAVSPAGGRLLAQGEVTGSEEVAAEWRRRGLRVGAWYRGHDFVWVADELGCVKWSREPGFPRWRIAAEPGIEGLQRLSA